MTVNLAASIDDFWAARGRGDCFPRAYAGLLTLDDAYRIQLGLIDRRVEAGEQHIGWKVGLTAKPIQEQFGFHEPVFGCILETKPSGYRFGASELLNPGFETELCLRIRAELKGTISLAEVIAAIDVIHPALEIIETRGDIVTQMPLAIADNAQQRSVVLGAPVRLRPELELDKVLARVEINGHEVATGEGSAVLAHPLNSIVWLAGKLSQFERHIRAGDIVMTGSFTRQFPLNPGDVAIAHFTGIGRVEVGISDKPE